VSPSWAGRARSRRPSQRHRWLWGLVPLCAAQLLASCGFMEPALLPITNETLERVEIPPIAHSTATMDAMLVDPTTQLLYVADGTDQDHQGVDIFDISKAPGVYLRYVPTRDVANGLALVPGIHRLYVGVDDGTVGVIDSDPRSPTFGTMLTSIQTSAKGSADLLTYDPRDQKVYVGNPDDGDLSVVDVRAGSPTIDTVIHRIENLGLIDQPMYDPADGMLYVSAVDDNLIDEIDPRSDTVVRRFPFSVPCEPHGLAVDPRTNQGIIGCSDKDEPVTIVWDFGRGQVIRYVDLAGAGDLATYDAKTDRFFFAASNFAPAEMAIFSGDPITYLTAVPTSHKSHGVAYDDVHDLVYTYDGRLREAGLWAFPDPVARCNRQLTQCLPSGSTPLPAPAGPTPGAA
jgi:DNA-binding beta-propeller fold protein YncE